MRFIDLFRLALSALWQRPGRTVMATLGVVIGTHVLISTLAIGQGVQSMILDQLRKQDQLRRISVWKTGGVREQEIPREALVVTGEMSDARRTRLREAIVRRYRRPTVKPKTGITPQEVRTIQSLPHVQSVTPGLSWSGKAKWGEQSSPAMILTASPDDRGIPRRIVAGRAFTPGEACGVLVSEYLLYRWGVRDERAVGAMIGKTTKLELHQPRPTPDQMLALLNVSGQSLSDEQKRVLDKALRQLPEALAKTDLTENEKLTLASVLMGPSDGPLVVEEQPILGVFRDVHPTEQSPWDGPARGVDVYVPSAVATKMFYALPGQQSAGLPWVIVRVDDESHIKEVQEQTTNLGLEAFSFAEIVDQVRLTVLLMSAACTLVAIVALTVAGLGIANTMLMSVLQRTHEIGVMKAIGARDGHILTLFLLEGALIGVLGASLGLLTSWLASYPGDMFARHLIEKQTPMRLEGSVHEYALWMVLIVPTGVVLWTTLAAVSPARRAAKIDPIEALRSR